MKVIESDFKIYGCSKVYVCEENHKLSDGTQVNIYTDFNDGVYIVKDGKVVKTIVIYEFEGCVVLDDYIAINGHEELMLYNLITLKGVEERTR